MGCVARQDAKAGTQNLHLIRRQGTGPRLIHGQQVAILKDLFTGFPVQRNALGGAQGMPIFGPQKGQDGGFSFHQLGSRRQGLMVFLGNGFGVEQLERTLDLLFELPNHNLLVFTRERFHDGWWLRNDFC